jgi:excinuclease ABC subunit B
MGITPETVRSNIKDILSSIYESDYWTVPAVVAEDQNFYGYDGKTLSKLEEDMKQAARNLDFERAAALRDKLKAIRSRMIEVGVKV